MLPLARLAAETAAGAAGGTASQFLSGGGGGGRFGGGVHGSDYSGGGSSFGGGAYGSQHGRAVTLDVAGRRAAVAVQLGLLQHVPHAQQVCAAAAGDIHLWQLSKRV